MRIKLAIGQECGVAAVEHVIVFHIDRGTTDEEILSMFDESSKEEVKKRIVAFRK